MVSVGVAGMRRSLGPAALATAGPRRDMVWQRSPYDFLFCLHYKRIYQVQTQFEGKVALVTGGGGGIGRGAALAFARAGARVLVADIAASAGEETAALVRAAGGEASFIRTDVTQAAQVQAMVG